MNILKPLILLMALTLTVNAQAHADHVDDHGPETGAHGGRLLDGHDMTVEVLLDERGPAPHFRVWVEPTEADLAPPRLTLTRLQESPETVALEPSDGGWKSSRPIAAPHSFDAQLILPRNGQLLSWEWSQHENRTRIDAQQARLAGITTALSGPGVIDQAITVYGRLVVPPDRQARVAARYPGMVTRVSAQVGDPVSAGDTLAVIESSDTLRHYRLQSPIDGLVVERRTNAGEITGDGPLFIIVSPDSLWAELPLYPRQRSRVGVGQTVRLQADQRLTETRIDHLTPSVDGQTHAVARARLDNSDGQWQPGDQVEARISVAQDPVPVRVDRRALQTLADRTVVFIQDGDQYEARPVLLGRQDEHFAEVLSGLPEGRRYVVEQSYLIKADLEKSGAAHEH